MPHPVPPNEEKRLEVLQSLGIMDTERDPRFDELCREAAESFRAPIALITLVDRNRQWFKSTCGLDVNGTPREHAFCTHAIMSEHVMVVPDARIDRRFAANPLVIGPPHVVFYAGAPIVYGEGIRLGTLCIIDHKPRQISVDDVYTLGEIADRISGEIWSLAFASQEET
ncbi:GAF domain-containing protein [Mongoliimonas terrestris]|uniref:GAF domain-containing protein n=1 Tax=Mongoliimonas terrestris TaxID=1709001 RepID=UPI0009497BEF|nr:GAF domain-containing protein [Mongoliimonas terrestris]